MKTIPISSFFVAVVFASPQDSSSQDPEPNNRHYSSPDGLPPYEKPFPTLSPYFTDIPALSSELVEIEEKNHWYTRLSPMIATALTPYTTDFSTTTPDFSGTSADDAQNVNSEGKLHLSTTATAAPVDSSSNSTVLPTEKTKINHWYTRLSSTIATALTPYINDITAMTPESSGITADGAQSLQFERKLHQPTSAPQTIAPVDSFSISTDLPTETTKINQWYTRLPSTVATALTRYFTVNTTTTLESSGTTSEGARSLEFEQREPHQQTSPTQTTASTDSSSTFTDPPSEITKINHWYFTDIPMTSPEFSGTTTDNVQSVEFGGKLHQPTTPSPTDPSIDFSSNSSALPSETTKTIQPEPHPQSSHPEPKDFSADQANSTGSSLNQKDHTSFELKLSTATTSNTTHAPSSSTWILVVGTAAVFVGPEKYTTETPDVTTGTDSTKA